MTTVIKPSDIKAPAAAAAWRAIESKKASDYYDVCILTRCPTSIHPGVAAGEVVENAHGILSASILVSQRQAEALCIHVMRKRADGTRIAKPAYVWYADDYKGKRVAL